MKKLLALFISLTMVLGTMSNVYATSNLTISDEIQINEVDGNEISIEIMDQESEEVETVDDTTSPEGETSELDEIPVSEEVDEALEDELSSLKAETQEDDTDDILEGILFNYQESDEDGNVESVTEGAEGMPSYSAIVNGTYPSQYVTPDLPTLRDQNPYGSCWAHATMALAEISLMKKGVLANPNLSELHLSYFTYNSQTDPLGGTAGDSNALNSTTYSFLDVGGNVNYGLHVLSTWQGAADESKVPYASATTYLKNGVSSSLAYDDSIILKNFYKQPYKTNSTINLNPIKELIMRTGAVSVSYKHSNDTGIYNKTNNCYYNPGSATGGHAVTIVGWDDNFPKENFTTAPEGDGAWLIRNSWYGKSAKNKGYAEESLYGYFWMSYYEPTIGSDIFGAEFDTADAYDNNYQYDGSMASSTMTLTKFANIFTAGSSAEKEIIKAVSFSTTGSNVSYKIEVYTNLTKATNPTSGTLSATMTGTTDFAGYYTVPLAKPVTIEHGKTFSVIISTTNSSKITLEIERNGSSSNWYKSVASSSTGQSFYYNGKNWVDISTSGAGNIRLKAFTDDYYDVPEPSSAPITVSLDANGGTSSVTTLSLVGTYSGLPTLSREGYTFDGWFSDKVDGTQVTNGNALISDTAHTLYAQWTAITYNVTLDANGDTSSVSNLSLYGTYSGLPTLSRTGYTFNGWFTAKTGGTKVVNGNSLVKNADHTLYAQWTANTYTIKFNANGGSGSMASMTCSYDSSYTLTANSFTPAAGYKFVKWNTKADGTGASYTDSASVKNISTSNGSVVNLYAQWEAVKYTITFNPNGGTTTVSSLSSALVYPSLPTPDRSGYTFDGWFTAATGGTKVNSGDTLTSYSNHTVYAHWTEIKYLVTLNANGGTSSVSSLSLAGSYSGLPTPTYTGYFFEGWYSSQTGGSKVNNGDALLIKAAHTLYAHWSEIKFIVTLDANGGTSSSSALSLYGQYSGLPTPVRAGYTFEGWYSAKTGGTEVTNGNNLVSDADHMLYARWSANKYTIKFNANGGTGSMADLSCSYGTGYTLTANSFSAPAGYEFEGWNTKTDGTGTAYANKATVSNLSTVNDSTIILYARWKAITFTITLDAQGGSSSTGKLYNALVYSGLPTASRDTYTFEGWFPTPEGGSVVSNGDKLVSYSDHTLYAHWSEIKTAVILDPNGGSVSQSSLDLHGTYKNLPVATKTGYRFNGWFTSKTGGSKITDGTALISNSSHTLYAQWSPVQYSIEFNANGGQGSMTAMTCDYDASYNLTGNAFTAPNGYAFTGWNTQSSGSGESYADKASVKNLLSSDNAVFTLYAQWEPVYYSVTFDPNGGTASYTSKSFALVYSDLPTAEKSGFRFAGWFTDKTAGSKVNAGDKLTSYSSHTLYAHWATTEYIITLDPNGGTTVISEIYCAKAYTGLPKPVRDGYIFSGWFSAPVGGTKVADAKALLTKSDHTLYAHWTAIKYTIRFIANGGKGAMSGIIAYYDSSYALSENKFTPPAGYEFKDWNSEKDGSGTTYTPGDEVSNLTTTASAKVDFYAQWKPVYYTITLDGNGGEPEQQQMSMALTYSNLPTPTRTGYTFTAWYNKTTSGTMAYDTRKLISFKDHTLYARWKANKYTITYDINGGTGTEKVYTVSYDKTHSIIGCTYTAPAGYKFGSWNTKPDGSGDSYVKSDKVTNLRSENGDNITLYAQWVPAYYTIKLLGNGGTCSVASVSNALVYSDLPVPTRTGYLFTGWYTAKTEGTLVDNGDTLHAFKGHSLYAHWVAITYTIRFDSNGGSGFVNDITATYNKAYTVDKSGLVAPAGYKFGSWNTEPDGTGQTFYAINKLKNLATEDGSVVTLYAQWKLK